VELGRRRQHLDLGALPQLARGRHQLADRVHDVGAEAALAAEVAEADGAEDLVDGGVGGQSAVDHCEVALQPLRNVVATAARLDHSCHELNVNDAREVAGLLQVVETCHIIEFSIVLAYSIDN